MGIRIQPHDIKVPEDDPFRYDLLGRKQSVEVLTHLVGSLEGPCVLAIDAAWGNGKTTFLNIWAQYLQNQGFPIIKFNAWETDFSGDPFVALSKELTGGLKEYTHESMAQTIEETTKAVLLSAVPGLIQLGAAGIPVVGQALASYAEGRLSAYQQAKESVPEFRRALQKMTVDVSTSKGGRPLIVMIDELDRCRPSYAVELLEVAKHLFAVGHIVFVLAVNRSELAHSIKALYGNEFDAQGYLRRFFDVDFVLPAPDRTAFIKEMLASLKIGDYFERTPDSTARREYELVIKWLQCFFHAPDLSLRRIAQAIHRLGLVYASLRTDKYPFALTAVVCLILRTINAELYQRFVHREVSDLEVVDTVFSRSWAGTLEQKRERALFEAIIIVAAHEEALSNLFPEDPFSSQLLQRYEARSDRAVSDDPSSEHDREHAAAVSGNVRWLRQSARRGIGFRESVQRIELFSANLIDDPITEQNNS